MRDLIISDIHGCFEELISLLEKIHFQKEEDRITFNGDLMDRGPLSYDCFRYIMDLKQDMGDRCNLIYGNHEVMLLDSVKGLDRLEHWERNGCMATIDSFRLNGADYRDAIEPIREYFLPYVMLQGVLVSHAGVMTERPEDMLLQDLIWNRDVAFGRSLYHGTQVVGHTPTKITYCVKRDPDSRDTYYYNHIDTFLKKNMRCILPEDTIFNIDGSCAYGGNLVCMELLPEKEDAGEAAGPGEAAAASMGDTAMTARYYRIRSVKSMQKK